jgi:hypothetical protein
LNILTVHEPDEFCTHSEEQSSIKSQLDVIQNEAEKLSSSSANELKEMRDDLTVILNKIQDMDIKDDSSSSDGDESDDGEAQNQLFKSLSGIMSGLSKLEKGLRIIPKETRVLQHLYFEDMFAREDSIESPSQGTFSWLTMTDTEFEQYISSWEDDSTLSDDENGSNDRISLEFGSQGLDAINEDMNDARQLFRKWLIHGEGVFHISGKAGSGKSTLMKFIAHDTRTVDCLKGWVDGKTLVLASFYFWRSDRKKLQMSLDGLYRSILFEVLRKCPHLIADVLPDQWRTMALQPGSMSFESDLFRPLKIKEAFEKLMQLPVQSENFAFCFFIDGLDEYEADPFEHKVLARHLRDWSIRNNIKMCVSSRPEIEYLDIFRQELRLNLHELTARDIYRSCQDLFEQDEAFPKVKGIYLDLLNEVVSKAEGVFLWACLVVKALLVEVGRDATSERLWQILRSTPPKLEDVYDGMLRSLSRQDRRMVDYILLLVLTNPFDAPMNAICLSWLREAEDFRFPGPGSRYSDQEAIRQLESIRRQLQGLTKGLLILAPYLSELGMCPMFSRRVQFFHRTARDYLTTPERKSQLDASFPLFDAYRTHSILRLAELTLVNTWNVPYPGELEDYATELIHLRHTSNSLYQQPYAHMKILKEIWDLKLKQTTSLQPFRFWNQTVPKSGSDTLFLNMVAFHGQIDFVRKELGSLSNCLVEAGSRVSPEHDISSSGRSSIILSALCSTRNLEMVPFLLGRGFHSQSYVSLFDDVTNKIQKVATVWIVFIAYISSRLFDSFGGGTPDDSLERFFKNLEHFLRAADQVPLVLLLKRLDSKVACITHFTTVEQLVLRCQPPNMNELLILLKMWRGGDGEEMVKVPWGSSQWEAFGAMNKPVYQAFDNLGEFVLEGVASCQEILTDLDAMAFQI